MLDIRGVVRADRRTKNLTKRLHPGEIALIDHPDLDHVAESLILKVSMVINASSSDHRQISQSRTDAVGRRVPCWTPSVKSVSCLAEGRS